MDSRYCFTFLKIYQIYFSPTFGSITKDDLFSLKVIKPKNEILKSFEDFIKPAFEKQNNFELENQQLASLRDWLLLMLMNGQVRVGRGLMNNNNLPFKKRNKS